jgi:hypothetical protein
LHIGELATSFRDRRIGQRIFATALRRPQRRVARSIREDAKPDDYKGIAKVVRIVIYRRARPAREVGSADRFRTRRRLLLRELYYHVGEAAGYNPFMGYDPVNKVTLVMWANLAVDLDEIPNANMLMLKVLGQI